MNIDLHDGDQYIVENFIRSLIMRGRSLFNLSAAMRLRWDCQLGTEAISL
jgi:hypothetical protein